MTRDDFNKFIIEWTGDCYPHLIDTDANDGERFRIKIDKCNKSVEAREKAIVERLKPFLPIIDDECAKRDMELIIQELEGKR
jgi:hypothetical protein